MSTETAARTGTGTTGATGNPFTGKRERVGHYFQVSMGKVIKSMGKEEPADMTGVTTRVNKNNERVYEIQSDYIRGWIRGADLQMPPDEHPEYGKTMVFTMEADPGPGQSGGGEKCIVQIPFDSAYGRAFLYSSPGLELDSPVEFEPYQYFSKKRGRDVTGMSVIQHGAKLDWVYGTKKNPGGVPPLEKITYKGKETWDNTKQLAFLETKFAEFCALFDEEEGETEAPAASAPAQSATAAAPAPTGPAPTRPAPQDDF